MADERTLRGREKSDRFERRQLRRVVVRPDRRPALNCRIVFAERPHMSPLELGEHVPANQAPGWGDEIVSPRGGGSLGRRPRVTDRA